MEVHREDLARVRPNKSSVPLVALVKDTQRTREGATAHSESVCGNLKCADSALVSFLEELAADVQSPHPEVLVL